jgi:hypothetical protein
MEENQSVNIKWNHENDESHTRQVKPHEDHDGMTKYKKGKLSIDSSPGMDYVNSS